MKAQWLVQPALREAAKAGGLHGPDSLYALCPAPSATSWRGYVEQPLAGTNGRFHLKCYRYPSWRKSRGLIGRGSLTGTAPEIAEFRALQWLRSHDVPAVRPIAAASTRVRGRLVAHALLTEVVPRVHNLADCLSDPAHPVRGHGPTLRALLMELGQVVARMHLHGFAHRDLHARNILVRVDAAGPRCWLLDCRRGGLGRRRGPLHDLASLRRDLLVASTPPLSQSDWLRFLGAYLGSGEGVGRLEERVRAVSPA
jgi:tRNA A-37 threonylcarbamoyl transferase component Bud32